MGCDPNNKLNASFQISRGDAGIKVLFIVSRKIPHIINFMIENYSINIFARKLYNHNCDF